MKKIAAFVAVCAVLVAGLFMFFDNSLEQDESIPESVQHRSPAKIEFSHIAPEESQVADVVEPPQEDDFPITKEQFDSLPQAKQQEILEEFVADFWEKELNISDETNAEEKSLSLEIFNRPYLLTLTEREFLQLSPEDQEKAMAEIGENCQEIRSYVLDVVAEAESLVADRDYLIAEAYLVHILEMGRELGANKEGMALTRLVGISCRGRALDGLVKLYSQTEDTSMVQMAQEQLSENQKEIKEIAEMVQQTEANN